tara:strand:+ start:223 stop:618 length:396 start_codon:yes stop_codon:yes gene_type:complete
MDTEPTTSTIGYRFIRGIKLDGWSFNNRRDNRFGDDSWAYGDEGHSLWCEFNHPELCDSCLLELGFITDTNRDYDSFWIIGVSDNCQSMEAEKELIMESFLGTIWFVCLVAVCSFAGGMYCKDWLMEKMGR